MQQPEPKSSNLLRSFGIHFHAHIHSVILPLTLVLLAVNIFCHLFIVGKTVNSNSHHITQKLDQITAKTQPVIQNWLNTTEDSLYIQQLWLDSPLACCSEYDISLLLLHDSVMVYWSNYTLPEKFSNLELPRTGTIQQIGTQQIITQYYRKDNHHAVVIINLHDNNTGDYNEAIFSEQRITLLPLSDSTYARAVKAEIISAADNQFYIEAKPIQNMPWWGELCGWIAILLLCLYIKNVVREHTTRYNVFKNATILMLCLILIRFILQYTGIPNDNSVLFDQIFGQYNFVVKSLGDMILSYSIAFIYIIYLFQVRVKLKWRFYQLSVSLRILTIVFYYVVIAFLISTFHYALIISIHDPNVNIKIYDIFELTYTSIVFYILATIFISTIILITRILFTLIATRYLWLRICFISVLIIIFLLPIESITPVARYTLAFFVALAAASDYLRLRLAHYSPFVMSLILLSTYIATVTTTENRAAQINNQKLYARYLATSQQDRDIVSHEEPNVNKTDIDIRFKYFTYARLRDNIVVFKHDNNIDYKDLNEGLHAGRDTTLYRNGYSHFFYNDYEQDSKDSLIVVSRREITILSSIALYAYILAIFFLLCFLLLRISGYTFNFQRLGTRMTLKIHAVVIIIVTGTMVNITMVISSHILNNFRNEKRRFIRNNSQRLQISIDRFLEDQTLNVHSANRWIKSAANDAEYNINIFAVDGSLIATSNKETTITRMNSLAYRDLHYMSHLFFVTNIDLSQHTSAYSPIIYKGDLLGYLNLQDQSSIASNSRLQYELLAEIIHLFLIIIYIAIILSYILYRFLARPFNKLRAAMGNISKMQKIDALGYSHNISDEVGLLVEQYNLMIDDLAESYRQLARNEREGAWREMAQQVAHEIKNPLTPMRLKIQMLQRAMKQEKCEELQPKIEATMNILLEQIDRLTKVTSDFSDFAKIGEGNPVRVNIIPIIHQVAKLYCDLKHIKTHLYLNIDNKKKEEIIYSEVTYNVSKHTQIKEKFSPIWVTADPDHLSLTFVNICQNAIQATTGKENSWLNIELRPTNNRIFISFCDNGHGIPEDICKKIFMPKFTTKSDGSGLGLPVSQKIVEAIGGHISFESTFGVGTTFTVELPLCE